ncbi:GntR family transcriptional regulator [Alicyclobacillaceae bacterium I2511]|nr:GntR family transcriptional regulator [Alicyclobacillaceae bacterium I2511]
MRFVLEIAEGDSLYQQIRNQVILALAYGNLSPGDGLPPIRALAADLSINLHTVHKGYEMLEQEGYIHLNRRIGAVVAQPRSPGKDLGLWQQNLRIRLAEAWTQGMSRETITQTVQAILADFVPVDTGRSGAEV